ncbi:protein of unknown function [Klenkia soli]|uniref:DUF222 domain-containing protein n=1 Tax=Klenkia soli TaxID=1052260 RepID=A0A1H0RTA5_9ACTN|nr:HNH endonuclease signature motif containing protein [Klenkia soli]SDP32707.1 protein of unknown function [Klenkia soli]
MTATAERFWVEVTPRRAAVRTDGPVVLPRLTGLAAAAGLEGAELDAELASVHRQMSALAAYQAGLVERKATQGAQHPLPFAPGARTDTRPDADDPSLQAADDFLPEEVAVLLNMSVASARYLVDDDLALVRQLPVVWHALADGRIDEARARVIVKALRYQAASWGGPVDDTVIDAIAARGVEWAAAGCPPTTLRERIDAALIAADPEAADRRKALRKREAGVRVTGTGDGLADLRATDLEAADAKLVKAQLGAFVRKLKADGDTRPSGEIEIELVVTLLTRPWEQLDPVIAHLTINADLADLLVPDLSDLIADADRAAESDADSDSDTDVDVHPGFGPTADPDETADADGGDVDDGDVEAYAAPADDAGATAGTAAAPTGDGGARPTDPDEPDDGTGVPVAWTGVSGAGTAVPGAGPPDGTGVSTGGTSLPAAGPHGDRASLLAAGPGACRGAQVGHVDGLPVTPAAVRSLLTWIDALGLTHPDGGGELAFTITGHGGRLLAVATPEELAAAANAGRGIGPPPAAPGYTPTAAQYRYLRARDRHCRFPGCRQVARACDADHVTRYDRHNPAAGGPTCVRNLAMLCRRHHRLKTHARGWRFAVDADGTLHVTTPGGTTRTTRPPAMGEVLDLETGPPPRYDPADDPPPF